MKQRRHAEHQNEQVPVGSTSITKTECVREVSQVTRGSRKKLIIATGPTPGWGL